MLCYMFDTSLNICLPRHNLQHSKERYQVCQAAIPGAAPMKAALLTTHQVGLCANSSIITEQRTLLVALRCHICQLVTSLLSRNVIVGTLWRWLPCFVNKESWKPAEHISLCTHKMTTICSKCVCYLRGTEDTPDTCNLNHHEQWKLHQHVLGEVLCNK